MLLSTGFPRSKKRKETSKKARELSKKLDKILDFNGVSEANLRERLDTQQRRAERKLNKKNRETQQIHKFQKLH